MLSPTELRAMIACCVVKTLQMLNQLKYKILLIFFLLIFSRFGKAQDHPKEDSLATQVLNTITITAPPEKLYLSDVVGLNIFSGKKTNLITLDEGGANLPQNNARTIFSKIPGINS
jgi:Fe(3+) dicitrate transport protein